MYSTITNVHSLLGEFHIEGMMLRYSSFVPRLYNLAKSLGFEAGKIVPSRAFCSDESQGYPIILITKHFGTFPFNHGRVGGIVATDRHAPHAEHGRTWSSSMPVMSAMTLTMRVSVPIAACRPKTPE